MFFLVKAELVETGPLMPPDRLVPFIEKDVLPSLETLSRWEEQGKAKGGVFAGQRAGAFVLEAASTEEVGELLSSLPFWHALRWDVIPLQSTRSTIERERKVLAQVRGAGKR